MSGFYRQLTSLRDLSHLTLQVAFPKISPLYGSANYDSNPLSTNKPSGDELFAYCKNIRLQHIIALASCIIDLYVMSDGC